MSVGRTLALLTQPARPRPPIPEDAVIIDLCSSESEDETPAAAPRTDLRVEDPRPPSSAAVSDDVAQYETEGNYGYI
jgi:hypothetical protein